MKMNWEIFLGAVGTWLGIVIWDLVRTEYMIWRINRKKNKKG
jgi:hypothetical protein